VLRAVPSTFLPIAETSPLGEVVMKKIEWLKRTLKLALKVNDNMVKNAFPSLHLNISHPYPHFNKILKNNSILFEITVL